jgi:hypothetical protein
MWRGIGEGPAFKLWREAMADRRYVGVRCIRIGVLLAEESLMKWIS